MYALNIAKKGEVLQTVMFESVKTDKEIKVVADEMSAQFTDGTIIIFKGEDFQPYLKLEIKNKQKSDWIELQ